MLRQMQTKTPWQQNPTPWRIQTQQQALRPKSLRWLPLLIQRGLQRALRRLPPPLLSWMLRQMQTKTPWQQKSDTMADTDAAAGAEAEKPEMAPGDTKNAFRQRYAIVSHRKKQRQTRLRVPIRPRPFRTQRKLRRRKKPELAAVDAMEPSAGAPSSPDVAVTADADVVADEVEDTVAAGIETKAGSDAAASAAAAKPEVAAVDTQAPSSGAAPTSTTVAADMDADEDTVAATDSADGTEVSKLATNMEADGPETIMQPALQPVDSSVIIRRGDTLWQISLRIYGKGVRYTTIYLANEDEIEKPGFH